MINKGKNLEVNAEDGELNSFSFIGMKVLKSIIWSFAVEEQKRSYFFACYL